MVENEYRGRVQNGRKGVGEKLSRAKSEGVAAACVMTRSIPNVPSVLRHSTSTSPQNIRRRPRRWPDRTDYNYCIGHEQEFTERTNTRGRLCTRDPGSMPPRMATRPTATVDHRKWWAIALEANEGTHRRRLKNWRPSRRLNRCPRSEWTATFFRSSGDPRTGR